MHLGMRQFKVALRKAPEANDVLEGEHGWARARKQFWAVLSAQPFQLGAERSKAMPKSDW